MRETLLALGADFTPFREMVKISKNHYGILTIMCNGTQSIHLNNHWSWSREGKDEDEYITSLFIPAIFTEEVIKRIIIKLSE